MSLLDQLSALGVNTAEGLNRFAQKAALFEKMLKKFPAAAADLPVLPLFEAGNLEGALANAHTLKGMTGNLSLTPLYEAYTEIVALLRADQPDQARALTEKILPLQEQIIACIASHQ
ncbi:MAG: Hpt domain-containing protein [Clostridia bacterium]|nr:Hpt domain-containing protein [Clostridia bacterium]MBQ3078332.1 Hpt domain-containing protein [Clostridia bacterium]